MHRCTPAATVELVRARAAAGETQLSIARALGLSPAHVSNIVRGRVHPDAGGPIRQKHGNERHGRHARRARRQRRR